MVQSSRGSVVQDGSGIPSAVPSVPKPGPVEVTANDPRYADFQMRGYNRRFIGAPESVVVVHDTGQVVDVVAAAVRDGRRIAVRSGGHCAEGLVDDPAVQVVVDLSRLDAVYYDPRMRAFAAEAGVTLGRLYEVLDLGWGVTLPGGTCPEVGLGGHVTGGGNGVLSRLYGHISDHLFAVEVVVVDEDGTARSVIATREEDDPHRDLWWAHTGGGGGNFGVVTRFWFRDPDAEGDDPAALLPRRPTRYVAAQVGWEWSKFDEESFSLFLRNFMGWCERNSAPGTATAALHGEIAVLQQSAGTMILMGRLDPSLPGSEEVLEAYLSEVTAGLPEPSFTVRQDEPWLYKVVNVPDAAEAFGLESSKLRTKIKAAYLRRPLRDEQLKTVFRCLTDGSYGHPASGIMITTWGGRMNVPDPSDTALPQRDSVMQMSVVTSWNDPAEDDKHLAWIRAFYADLFAGTGGVPVSDEWTDGSYINWPDPDLADPALNTSGVPWSTLYYGDNYARLQRIKAHWDPRNVFSHALSIERP
ncbi:FAD-dependent oxidoreductase [Streptomyces viridochromogenes]|nr:FAD-binding protein [Streptomyces viridochromogenes]